MPNFGRRSQPLALCNQSKGKEAFYMQKPKSFPDFWGAVFILVGLIGLQFIIAIIAYVLGYTFEAGDPSASGIITVLSCGLLFYWLMDHKKLSAQDVFNPTSQAYSMTGMITSFTIPFLLIVGGAVFWISDIANVLLLYFPMDETEYLMFDRVMNGGMVSIIVICIIAPFTEEVLFRGIILRSFLSNYSVNHAIILSAVLFAAFHLTLVQLPVALIMGLFLGWLYVQTRLLWPTILAHALYNLCAILFWSANVDVDSPELLLTPTFNSIEILLASLLSTFIGVKMLMRVLNR